MAQFKNYTVTYDLVVNATKTQAFDKIAKLVTAAEQPIKGIATALREMSSALGQIQQLSTIKFEPTVNLQAFKTQLDAAVRLATESGKAAGIAYQNAMNQATSGKAGQKGVLGKTSAELRKEIAKIKDDIKAFGSDRKKGTRLWNAKQISNEKLEAEKAEKAKLQSFLQVRQRELKEREKIEKAAAKINEKATKTASVKIPAIVVNNAETMASLNAVIGQLNRQVKPIVIPITIATNANAARALRGTISGLRDVANKAVGIPTKPTKPSGLMSSLKMRNYREELGMLKRLDDETKHPRKNKIPAAEKQAILGRLTSRALTEGMPYQTTAEARAWLENRINTGQNARSEYARQLNAYRNAAKGGTGGIPIPIVPTVKSTSSGTTSMPTQIASNTSAGFGLNAHLLKLQELANTHPLNIPTRIHGTAGFSLNLHLAKLQEVANAHPIRISTVMSPSAIGVKPTTGTKPVTGVKSTYLAPATSIEKAATKALTGKGAGAIGPSVSVMPINILQKVLALKMLAETWNALPKTGNRTFTVNLKTPGIENVAKLRELIAVVQSLPRSTSRTYSAFTNTGVKTPATGVPGTTAVGGGAPKTIIPPIATTASSRPSYTTGKIGTRVYTPTTAWGQRKASMNGFGYQLMGNTSLGARTPMFLDMMKGMGMMTGVGAAMGTLTTAFTNAAEYQNTMSTASAILRANYKGNNFESDFKNMERIVRDVAKQTKFTAPQAADAARFMAMAGLNIPMINASIRPIADVAVIGDNDLGEVADKITNIQTAFKIKPQQMRSLADALTKTFTSSNTDMMMLAESMEYAAPVAHLAGAKVEDALAMIGVMGNAGIQGSMAGTTLRMMYQNVINPNKNQKLMWEKLGINLRDEKGNPRQLIDILGDLRKRVRINEGDKEFGEFKDEGTPIAEAVSRLFRVTASAGAGTLIENLDKVIKLAEENRNAQGLSESISLTKQNNVKGMWAKMTSAFTDAVVNEFESSESPIKGYLHNITEYFKTSEFQSILHDLFDLVTSMMNMLGKFVKIWRKLYQMFGGMMKYVWMLQFILAQIGYTLAPLRSVYQTITKGIGAAGLLGSGLGMAGVGAASRGLGAYPGVRSASGLASAGAMTGATAASSFLGGSNLQQAINNQNRRAAYASRVWYRTQQGSKITASNWSQMYLFPNFAANYATAESRAGARYAKELTKLKNLKNVERYGMNSGYAMALAAMSVAPRERVRSGLERYVAQQKHRKEIIRNKDFASRAMRQNRFSYKNWKTFTSSQFKGNFRNAVAWAPTFRSGGLVAGFTSVITRVGTLLGALCNPITALIGVLGGSLFLASKIDSRRKQEREEYKAHNQTLKTERDLARRTMSNTAIEERSRLGYGVMRLGKIDSNFSINSGSNNVLPDGTVLAKNPLMRNLKGVNKLFANQYEEGYVGTALEHISAYSRLLLGEQLTSSQVWNKLGYELSTSHPTQPVATQEIVKNAAIAAVMEASSHYVYADKLMQPIQRRLEEWTKIKDVKAAEEEWSKILADAKILAEQYNPKGKNLTSLQNYTPEQIGNMPFSQAFNTYEGQLALYDKLKSVEDPDHPLFGYFHALRRLRSDVQMNAQEVMDTVFKVSGGVQYELPDMNGQIKVISQAFNDGKLKWEDFQKNIQMYGLNVKNTLGAFHEIIYKTFIETRNIALEAGKVPPSIQEFLNKNGVNIPQEYINTMTQDQKDTLQKDVVSAYYSNPSFKQYVDKEYGGIENYVKKHTGSSWFGGDRNFPAKDINRIYNESIENRVNQEDAAASSKSNNPVKTDKSKTTWGKWGSMFGNGQQAYINKYSNQSAMPSWTALNNHIEINIDGRNIDDERLGTLIGDKVVNAIGAIADRNSNNYMG